MPCSRTWHGTPMRLWGWGEKMGMKLTRRAGRADAEHEAGAHVQFLLKLVTFLRGGSPDATSHGAAPRPPCPFATSEILHAAPATLTEPWTHGTLGRSFGPRDGKAEILSLRTMVSMATLSLKRKDLVSHQP